MNNTTANKILDLNRKSYNLIAQKFSQSRQRPWPEFKNFISYLKDGDKILDLGCGNARLLLSLNDISIDYTGIDMSKMLIEQAKSLHTNNKFKYGDVLTLDEPENLYNAVFSIAMLNHIPSIEYKKQTVQNIYKTIKPGGYLFMTNWNLWKPSLKKKSVFNYWWKRFKTSNKEWQNLYDFSKTELSFKDQITYWKSGNINEPLYYYAFTKREITKLLESVGFTIEQAYYSHGSWYKGGNIIIIAKK